MANTGEQMNSANLLQLVRESTPGVYNAAGDRLVMTSLRGDFAPEESWGSFRPSGYNVDAWHALERTHQIWSGTFRWDFKQDKVIIRMLCGTVKSDTTTSGKRTLIYTLPESGPRDLEGSTYTLEYGLPTDCLRCPYGLLLNLSMPGERTSDTLEGQITILCQKPSASGVAMTGTTPQNEVQTLVTGVGYGGGTVNIGAQNGGAAQTITPGTDNLAAIQTKLAAALNKTNGDIIVTGTSTAASGSGIGVYVAGAGTAAWNGHYALTGQSGGANYYQLDPTHLLYFVTNTWYLGSTLGATSGAAYTVSGTNSSVPTSGWATGTGSASAPTTFPAYASVVIAGAGTAGYNGTYLPNGNVGSGGAIYQLDASHFIVWDPGFSKWGLGPTASGGGNYLAPTGSLPTIPSSGWTVNTASAPAPTATPTVTGGTGAGLNLVATFSGASVTNSTQSLLTSGTAGVTIARTQIGSSGILAVEPRVPILNRNISVRKGASLSAVEAATALNKAMMFSWELNNLVDPIWFFNENETTFGSHVDGAEPAQTLSFRLAKSSTDLAAIETEAKSQPATPKWWQGRAVHADDSNYSLRAEFFASVTGAIPLGAGGNVRYKEIPLAAAIEGGGFAVRFTLTEPA